MKRFVIWRGWDGRRTEAAEVELGGRGLLATGVQLGADPLPYRLDYELDASDDWRTKRLEVEARGEGWWRRLSLTRGREGDWSADTDATGDVDLPAPGGAVAGLAGAVDCDLGYSPLTNAMPVRREGLADAPGAMDFVMAWVAVPELTVEASPQRYEHVRRTRDGAVVRYVDRGRFAGFTAELDVDRDGLVRIYPELATRIDAVTLRAAT